MHETELNDLSDDVDYAASIQQGSASMHRSDSGKRDSSSEPEGAETVYTKENVTIHPTHYASERISGRLKLFKQASSLFMTWIPYKGQSSNSTLSDKDKNLYTIRAVPFSEIRSIRRHTPTLGWQYVIVVLSSGLAFPPFYFYNGGVREFFAAIKQHVFLVRSAENANVFLVNDFQSPLQKTLSSLEFSGPAYVVNVPTPSASIESSSTGDQGGIELDTNSSHLEQKNTGRQKPKHHDPARDLSIHVLEKFSLVTRFARETTSQLFGDVDGFAPNHEKKQEQLTPSYDHVTVPNHSFRVRDEVSTASNAVEVDRLSLVWGKPRQPPLCVEEWNTFLDTEGRILDSLTLRKRIFYGGVDHNLRNEAWTFLLGFYTYDSTYAEREYLMSLKETEYETLKMQWQCFYLVKLLELNISNVAMHIGSQRKRPLCIITRSISLEQAKRFTKFRERKGLIEKDVVRTDRSLPFYDGDDNPNVHLLHDILLTYSFYNFDLGYCQGMSDLLSPILYVMRDEAKSFWCFASLMEQLGPNFNRDQSGIHSQLFALSKLVELLDSPLHNYFKQSDCLNYFFCFRWILIQFKREFDYDSTMRLWEVLWTHYPSEHLHLYVCVAILKRHCNKIIAEEMCFDTLLKFINELSGRIDLDATLREAEALCIHAGENGAACIPPGTPPSLPLEDASVFPQMEDDVL